MNATKKVISIAVWLGIFLAAWEIAAYILSDVAADPLAAKKLPHLGEIYSSFQENGRDLLGQAAVTFRYAAAGFGLGTLAGAALALLMSLSGLWEKMVQPYLLISQMIPILGLAPIVLGLFKDMETSRVVIAAYITFFPVSITLLSGLKSAEKDLKALMQSCAASRFQLYSRLLVPGALPHLFSGLKISAPMAVTASILVDTLSASDGIGYVIIFTLYGGGTAGQFWPALITAALMGAASFFVVSAVEYLCVFWKRPAWR